MYNHNIGQNIAQLRKERGITQETLADAVGVSGQSVSKWEGGGSPDTMLLPEIADYFGVSIDRLYGRKARNPSDLMDDLTESIMALSEDKRIGKVYEYCSNFIYGLAGGVLTPEMYEHILKEAKNQTDDTGRPADFKYGRVETSGGIVTFGLKENLPYYMVIPEPEKGWAQAIHFKDEYVKMFELLADADTLQVLFYLYQREGQSYFTPKLVNKKLGISLEKAEEALKALAGYGFADASEVEIDGYTITTYKATPFHSFVPFMIFTDDMCIKPTAQMQLAIKEREKPYLWQE